MLIAIVFRHAEKLLVLGSRDKAALSSLLCLRPSQITVLRNAAPDPLTNVAEARCRGGPCHFVFVGHLSSRKGVPELLKALSRPALRSRPWRATLAGGGPVDHFRRLTRDFSIADRVNFPGWIDEAQIAALYLDADVVVLPSHAEGLAMSVLEGLAHGLAVVTTPVGAHSEVVQSEVSGLFVPPGNVDALTAALVRVIDDASLRQRLGAEARQRYLEKFDLRRYAERLSRLHASLLVGSGPVETIAEEQTTQ
jgi:glycosyltransferase involved in cell wall biosynthesis